MTETSVQSAWIDTLPGLSSAGPVRLRADLLPPSTHGSNLRSFLERSIWDRLRRPVCAAAGDLCQICGQPSFARDTGRVRRPDCHEQWGFSVRGDRRVQTLCSLVALCSACHRTQHIGLAQKRGELDLVIDQLCSVNGWDDAQASADLGRARVRMVALERFEWDLDLSELIGQIHSTQFPTLYIPVDAREDLILT